MANGNQSWRSRSWCFTLHHPSEEQCSTGPAWGDWEHLRYGICQLEIGNETGTLHLQGYLEFGAPMRLNAVRALLGENCHWEPKSPRSTREEARDYCRKEEGACNGPWEVGRWEMGGQGKRNEMRDLQAHLDSGGNWSTASTLFFAPALRYASGIDRYVNERGGKREWEMDVIVIVGPSGCGKSRGARELCPDAHYWGGDSWWDGYSGQRSIVLDDFYGGLPFRWFLRFLDRYPLALRVKGSTVQMLAKSIIITSNALPNEWYSADALGREGLNALHRRITKLINFYEDTCVSNWDCTEQRWLVSE